MEHGGGGAGAAAASVEPEVTAGRLNTQQLLMLEDDTLVIEEREKEIQNVVASIVELNTIFKDLAVMVSEQVLKKNSFPAFETYIKSTNRP